ncbi:MAG: RNA polymerase sigma factor SigZ [Pirellulaceae bacterium]
MNHDVMTGHKQCRKESVSDDSISTERIWKLLSERLSGFIRQRVSDEQVADDLLQETFVRIHKNLGDFDDAQRITPWVFQVARNLVIDHYRSRARQAVSMVEELETKHDVEEHLNELVAGWLPGIIEQLPETYREAVELYELKGVSQQEIADQLGISLSGAKSRVQRGREKMKSILFDCCSFENDRRGNVIGFSRNSPAPDSTDSCEC